MKRGSPRPRWPWSRLLAAIAAAVIGATVVLGAVVAAAPAALAAPASAGAPAMAAHAALSSTEPADGSVVSKEPSQVTATFDQPVGVSPTSLVVYTPNGGIADNGQTIIVSPYEIGVSLLPGLGNGTYTATWHVISEDTHPVQGAFTFSIGAPSATHVAALQTSASNVLVSILFAIVRWLEYAFFFILGGGVAFLIICWPEGAARRGVSRLIAGSWAGLLISTLLGLLLQGPYSAGTGMNQLFNASVIATTFQGKLGPASEARELMSLLAGGVASFFLPRLPSASQRARVALGAAWAVLTTAVAASWAVYDHASTGIQVPVAIPDDIVHLDAAALWIGGLTVLALFTLRSPDSAAVARAVPRFSAIALTCVCAIIASGVYETWRLVGAWAALVYTPYGRLILGKITGLLVLIALGYVARRYIQRGLAPAVALVTAPAGTAAPASATAPAVATSTVAALAGGPATAVPAAPQPGEPGLPGTGGGGGDPVPPGVSGPGWAPAMRKLRLSVGVELLVAAVILAFTALLVNTATGREAYAPTVSASQSFNTGGPGGIGTVNIFVGPATLGDNTIDVYLSKPGGHGAFVPAQIQANLYFNSKDIGPLPVTLKATAAGQFRAQDVVLTFTGEWTLQLIIRSDAFDETSVTFGVAVHS